MKSRLIRLLVLAVIIPTVFAQEKKHPDPSPPFVARVSVPAMWTITFTRPAEDEIIDIEMLKKMVEGSQGANSELMERLNEVKEPISNPMIRVLQVVRTPDFTKELATFSDETTLTDYVFNVARITKHVAFDGLIRSRREAAGAKYSPNYAAADFSGLDWLSLANYRGVENVQSRPCYYFEAEIKPESVTIPGPDGKPLEKTEPISVRAFIDVETKLPVSIQLGRENRTFAFGTPTAADMAIPPEIVNEIQSWKAEMASATKAAPAP